MNATLALPFADIFVLPRLTDAWLALPVVGVAVLFLLAAMFLQGTAVQDINPLPGDEHGLVHWASFRRSSLRSAKILSAIF